MRQLKATARRSASPIRDHRRYGFGILLLLPVIAAGFGISALLNVIGIHVLNRHASGSAFALVGLIAVIALSVVALIVWRLTDPGGHGDPDFHPVTIRDKSPTPIVRRATGSKKDERDFL